LSVNGLPNNAGGGSSGLKPPTELTAYKSTGNGAVQTEFPDKFGVSISGAVTSASVQTVMDLQGQSGVVNFLAITPTSGSPVTACKIKITIDGIVVHQDTDLGALVANASFNLIGTAVIHLVEDYAVYSSSDMPFENSFKVEIAGDGTDGVHLMDKRYKTS